MWLTFIPFLLVLFFVGPSFGQPDDPGFNGPVFLENSEERVFRDVISKLPGLAPPPLSPESTINLDNGAENDGSRGIVENYLAKLNREITTRKYETIADYFWNGFTYIACNGTYEKATVVNMLVQFPRESKMEINITSSKFRNYNVDIDYTVVVRGFGSVELISQFHLYRAEIGSFWRLTSGRTPICPSRLTKNFLENSSNSKTPEKVAEQFLIRMKRSIESKDYFTIAGLFKPNFVFSGCETVYNKIQIVGRLMNLPPASNHTLTIKHAEKLGSVLTYTIVIPKSESDLIEVELFLDTNEQQLIRGSVSSCKTNGSLVTVKKFLLLLNAVIKGKDAALIGDMFLDSFMFYGCKGNYDKAQVIEILLKLPPSIQMTMTIKSSKFTDEGIEYTVVIGGALPNDIVAVFNLYLKPGVGNHWRLSSGKRKKCDELLHHFGQLESTKQHFAMDDPSTVVNTFLVKMTEAIESKNSSIIADLFEREFSFRGCKGTYSRDQVVRMILKFSAESDFSYSIEVVEDQGNSVVYNAKISEFGEAQFVLNINNQQLESGRITYCSKNFHVFH
ncbi:hypothetical protein GCK72_001155 [Caenorhabditis remanei]|uniref:NTF2-like domain-containing protein n=1 Tax=Caenorhabditis remanei TaxID=31234 RepID=A0A6A5HN51_CAERE|nr:hypothetical protein GCK72_001155 [Caenorhabditis remanei]KAF1769338.1 hypothetical protein GCK72_001155 [Caenorhabditis remanei]